MAGWGGGVTRQRGRPQKVRRVLSKGSELRFQLEIRLWPDSWFSRVLPQSQNVLVRRAGGSSVSVNSVCWTRDLSRYECP